ncbi:MAG: hypothetical protein OER86_12095 [Phycisphaerae bacterium]|nr:hypothetical protein [Phycisphaerae bacterium]
MFTAALVLAPALAVGGCGSGSVTVADWQAQLEQHANDQANGDLNAAIRRDPVSGRFVFSLLGANHPDSSADVVGLLLGRRAFDERQWLVFLLAEVDRRAIRAMRLAAVAETSSGLDWRLGADDAASREKYLRHRNLGTEAGGRGPYVPWPSTTDRFELQVQGSAVTVQEQSSAAAWRLDLATPEASQIPSATR